MKKYLTKLLTFIKVSISEEDEVSFNNIIFGMTDNYKTYVNYKGFTLDYNLPELPNIVIPFLIYKRIY